MSSVLIARQRSLRREVALEAARPEDPRSAEAILPFTQLYAIDAYVFAAGLGVYGITQHRWALLVALVALAAGVTTTLWPDQALYTYSGLGLAGALLAGLLAALEWRARRRAP